MLRLAYLRIYLQPFTIFWDPSPVLNKENLKISEEIIKTIIHTVDQVVVAKGIQKLQEFIDGMIELGVLWRMYQASFETSWLFLTDFFNFDKKRKSDLSNITCVTQFSIFPAQHFQQTTEHLQEM